MTASIILAHPYPESFNHAIYKTAIKTFKECGIKTHDHDLYAEEFDPLLTVNELGENKSIDALVNQYADELVDSDYLLFIHPNWWGQPPAILKGYIDRVVRPPHAYEFPQENYDDGLPTVKLNGKYGIVFNTSNTFEEREQNYFRDPLEQIWGKCVFGFLGIDKYYRHMFKIIAESTEEQRITWLKKVETDLKRIISE